MSSAFDKLGLPELIEATQAIGAQGIDLCVFRRDGTRQDHIATHLDYDYFTSDTAKKLIDDFNTAGLRLSVGSFENLIGGDPAERIKNQNHLLKLIRIAHLLGGDANDVKVGTFVGYNHELGAEDGGFQKNLDEYQRIFTPIISYAEDLGVTVLYENCPMEGWRPASFTTTYNNLPGVLAARKLMYALIPSKAHGEIYDPSHDVWQHTDPVDVVAQSDISRIQRIHVKATRNLKTRARIDWGGMYPMQSVDADLAEKAGVDVPKNDWDRHHYEAMLPGFGGSDSMDWRAFVELLSSSGFTGPYEIENEAGNSKDTGNLAATIQGFQAAKTFLAPMLWDMDTEKGYQYRASSPLSQPKLSDVPVMTIDRLS
ncbi:Sugar phosphate isomerase/epimerase [Parapedobacter indicus]|uniref:Sugar phosphate isomerase/epimerase n=2 Tax=Parapedobacter indicus TaxID=1477437 RepID=A0A1I3RNV0_9SPHI|nr:sugar phosphate isomerase/epimerase [Parapedobacter indicus]SFJ46876.1 Sugar phosphate isomerase/epimerase [Parapedobacter indicus]